MQFTPSDIAAMISAMGQTMLIGITPVTGIYSTGPRELQRNGAVIWTDEPTLLIAETDAEQVTLNQTIITINNVDYQAYNRVPDGSGFVEFDLTRDF